MPTVLDEVNRLIKNLEGLRHPSQSATDRPPRPRGRDDPNGCRPPPAGADHRGDMIDCTISLARALARHRRDFEGGAAKRWYRQKTFWTGVLLIVAGTGELIAGASRGESVAHIAQGLGLISLRQAVAGVQRQH